jgi:photosystem II stability/assembly factor-like uncharacterized protein
MSASGQYQTVGTTANISISSDYGNTWITVTGSTINNIAVSASGQYQIAINGTNPIYLSSNYGVTWNNSASGVQDWYSIAMSSTGQYAVACVGSNGNIFRSYDYGNTWSQFTTPTSTENWICIAMSSSGQYMTLSTSTNYLYNFINPIN